MPQQRKPRKRSGHKKKSNPNPAKPEDDIPTEPDQIETPDIVKNSSDENLGEVDNEGSGEVEEREVQGKERREKREMSEDEKIAVLNRLSKADPISLLRQLALLSNRAKAEFIAKIDKDDNDKFTTSLTAHYCDIKITVPTIPTRSERYAVKIGSDLILDQIYGEKHTLEEDTVEIKKLNGEGLIVSKDQEYFVEKEKDQQKIRDKKADRMVNRIELNKNLGEEEKKEKIARFEAWRHPLPNQLTYDEIYKKFDHPYFRILCNVIKRCGFRMKFTTFKIVDGKEIEMENRNRRRGTPKVEKDGNSSSSEKESLESDQKIVEEGDCDYKVTIKITHLKKDLLDYISEPFKITDNSLKEQKSEACYNALNKLLCSGEIRTISKADGWFHDRYNNRSYGRYNRNKGQKNRSNGRYKRGQGQGQGQERGQGDNRSNRNGKDKSSPRSVSSKNSNQEGQMMMMPVTLDKNGKYTVMQNAQPMMMQASNAPAGNPAPRRRRKNHRKKNNVPVVANGMTPIAAN